MHLEQLINLSKLIAKTQPLQTAEMQDILVSCLRTELKLRTILGNDSVEKLGRVEKTLNAVKLGKREDEIITLLATIEREKSLLALSIHQIDAAQLQSIKINIIELQTSFDAASQISRDTARNVEAVVETLPDIADRVHGIYEDMPKLTAELKAIQEQLGVTMVSRTPETEAPENCIYEVPNRRIRDFVGRESILALIDARFNSESEKGPRIIVLRAMGGQGKTQIALEYCRRTRNRTGTAVFWVDASSESTLRQSYSSFSESLVFQEGIPQNIDARVNFTVRKLRTWQSPWLIVFDNYNSPAKLNNLEDYMPENDKGMILITTRHADADRLAIEDNQIQLPGLPEFEVVKLLLKQCPRTPMDNASLKSGRVIVPRLGYHALAIAQAGAYISKRKVPLEEFLDQFERRKDIILKDTTPQMSQYRRKLGQAEKETSLSVFTTWELSYRQLLDEDTEDKCMADLLTLFAFFDPSSISESLFKAYCNVPGTTGTALDESGSLFPSLDEQELDNSRLFVDRNEYQVPGAFLVLHKRKWDSDSYCDALAILSQLSLVEGFTRTMDGLHKVTLHPLVRDWIRLRTQKNACAEYTYLAATCIDRLLRPCLIEDRFLVDFDSLIAQEVLKHFEAYMTNLEDIFPQDSNFLSDSKRGHFDIYDLHLGILCNQFGQHEKGKELHKRCLARRGNETAPNDSVTRQVFWGLAHVLLGLGECKEAEFLLKKALRMVLEASGKENEEAYRRALKLQEAVLGREHPLTLTTLSNLANVLTKPEDWKEKGDLYRQAFELGKRFLGKITPK